MTKSIEESDTVDVSVKCVLEENRLVQVYSDGQKQTMFCIHGVIYRWHCDECEEFMEKTND